MSYRIPREAEIVKAIENVLVRNPHIRSQAELTRLVSDELYFMDQEYKISGNRIRKVGLKYKLFRIDIRYARSDRKNSSGKCPVCGSELESIKNRTLEGGTVELMKTCKLCGYAGRTDAEKPARYIIDRRL